MIASSGVYSDALYSTDIEPQTFIAARWEKMYSTGILCGSNYIDKCSVVDPDQRHFPDPDLQPCLADLLEWFLLYNTGGYFF